jgi:2'-5' RNA ligase
VEKSKSRFFIALLPPLLIQDYANQIRQIFADRYASRGAQNSPPHITLQPPFEWANVDVPLLEECLREFALLRQSVPTTLSGYAAFAPRVIYINVVRNQELLTLQAELMAHLETNLGIADKVSQTRPFVPHMTVAFKDLTKQNFHNAWQEFENKQVQFEFNANNLILLLHDNKHWNIKTEFPFLSDNN